MNVQNNVQALPPGWEMQYDQLNNRCFFIDHVNKKTTWDDPRLVSKKKENAITYTKYVDPRLVKKNSSLSKPVENLAMHDLSKSQDKIMKPNQTSNLIISENFGSEADHILYAGDKEEEESLSVEYVSKRFPFTSIDCIEKVISKSSSYSSASKYLISMGYKEFPKQKPTINQKKSFINYGTTEVATAKPETNLSAKVPQPVTVEPHHFAINDKSDAKDEFKHLNTVYTNNMASHHFASNDDKSDAKDEFKHLNTVYTNNMASHHFASNDEKSYTTKSEATILNINKTPLHHYVAEKDIGLKPIQKETLMAGSAAALLDAEKFKQNGQIDLNKNKVLSHPNILISSSIEGITDLNNLQPEKINKDSLPPSYKTYKTMFQSSAMGPNKSLQLGPDKSLVHGGTKWSFHSQALGRNSSFHCGPKRDLAHGSMRCNNQSLPIIFV